MVNIARWVFASLCAWAFLLAGPSIADGETWVEESFEDFADGRLDASGQNIYVSRDGKIRTIHRFDLDQDGHVDLIFNSTHDTITFIPATCGTVTPEGQSLSASLEVQGSRQVELADLNRDGWLDAVFCPNDSGLQHPRRFVTTIYGGKDGWPARRSNGILPVNNASGIAVADLNADGWPDIAVLNGEAWLPGQPSGRVVRIFWGSERGYLLSRRRDLGVSGAIQLTAGDFDGDGARDLSVLTGSGEVRVFWATASADQLEELDSTDVTLPGAAARCLTAADINGDNLTDLVAGTSDSVLYIIHGELGREWSDVSTQPAFNASHVAVGDLDGDRHPDLVLSNFDLARAAGGEAAGVAGTEESIRILWGAVGGFSDKRLTELHVPYASATAIGDMDADGRADLVVAVHQTNESFTAESVVLFGQGHRRFQRCSQGFATHGAIDVSIAPSQGSLPARAVFANSLGGVVGEYIPLHLYWGGPKGFAPERRLEIPFRSGCEATSADLNADGFVDLVAINSQHTGALAKDDPTAGANIFWGDKDGFDFTNRRTVLREPSLGTSNTADLNRDGYLDLVLGAFDAAPGQDESTPVVIYYGSAEGFPRDKRVALPCKNRSLGNAIADFNHDDWLDIAVVSAYQDRVRIFWGGAEGFDAERQSSLDLPYPVGLETADLNADGHLDLIVGTIYDTVTRQHDVGTTIFWGSEAGFRPWDAQRLPGWSPPASCVADFDGDGFLDVFTPSYLGEITRESMPNYIYWGGPDGYSPRRRTNLICDSGHDALAGDFDHDGRLDLAVSCHTKNGSHYTDSLVFYNDGNRFRNPRTVRLPTHGTHWMWAQDMGHIYNRAWRQTYESSVCNIGPGFSHGQLRHVAAEPEGTSLVFFIRAASCETDLPNRPWRRVSEDRFMLQDDHRYLQYRVLFQSDNGDRFPVLDRVTIDLE